MALINCPKCTKEISDMTSSCVHCRFRLNNENKKIKKVKIKKPHIIGVILCSLIIISSLFILNNNNLSGTYISENSLNLIEELDLKAVHSYSFDGENLMLIILDSTYYGTYSISNGNLLFNVTYENGKKCSEEYTMNFMFEKENSSTIYIDNIKFIKK